MFQFHTGSIKSVHFHNQSKDPYQCFNSILVRLKDSRFPSKKNLISGFQFHTGSIKS